VNKVKERDNTLNISECIRNLADLKVVVKTVVEGFYSGIHRSMYKGFSTEFSEHREYLAGDDIKYIDWNVYARRDRHYIKEFEAETSVKTIIALDVSSSMDYAMRGGMNKLDYSVIISACLSYLLIKQRDSVGLLTYSSEQELYIPPRSTNFHLNQIYQELTQIKADGGTNTAVSLFNLGKSLQRRSLIILLSDLWDDGDEIFNIIRAFREKKNEVIIFHIQDPFEGSPQTKGSVRMRDIETGREIEFISDEYLSLYRGRYEDRCQRFYEVFGEMDVDFITISTDTFPTIPLTHFLKKRERLS